MKTKIVATIGPSCDNLDMITRLGEAGMDIARVNFSHAKHEGYKQIRDNVLKASRAIGKQIVILADMQGPRMRVGTLEAWGKVLKDGEKAFFTTDPSDTSATFIDNPLLHKEILVNDPLFLLNGEIECIVTKVEGSRIETKVIRGGKLFSRKGVNTPNTKLSISGLTEKDIADVQFVLKEGVDLIAISFVQNADDVRKLRTTTGNTKIKIVSKIETKIALDNIDEITRESDALMIARGDLGIEVPSVQLPFIQHHLIELGLWHKKPTITATQMLMSMVDRPQPTRAEITDVTNAIWDGTDAVMLSDETASGNYPLEAVQMMKKIALEAERVMYEKGYSL